MKDRFLQALVFLVVLASTWCPAPARGGEVDPPRELGALVVTADAQALAARALCLQLQAGPYERVTEIRTSGGWVDRLAQGLEACQLQSAELDVFVLGAPGLSKAEAVKLERLSIRVRLVYSLAGTPRGLATGRLLRAETLIEHLSEGPLVWQPLEFVSSWSGGLPASESLGLATSASRRTSRFVTAVSGGSSPRAKARLVGDPDTTMLDGLELPASIDPSRSPLLPAEYRSIQSQGAGLGLVLRLLAAEGYLVSGQAAGLFLTQLGLGQLCPDSRRVARVYVPRARGPEAKSSPSLVIERFGRESMSLKGPLRLALSQIIRVQFRALEGDQLVIAVEGVALRSPGRTLPLAAMKLSVVSDGSVPKGRLELYPKGGARSRLPLRGVVSLRLDWGRQRKSIGLAKRVMHSASE